MPWDVVSIFKKAGRCCSNLAGSCSFSERPFREFFILLLYCFLLSHLVQTVGSVFIVDHVCEAVIVVLMCADGVGNRSSLT